jgi:hypothetical protein
VLPVLAQEALGAGAEDDDIGPGLAVGEATDLKRGAATACVSPRRCGVTGKTENCVTWVFSALVTATGRCRAWSGLYMPECRAKDPARREKAGIPRSLAFATRPDLAIAQVGLSSKRCNFFLLLLLASRAEAAVEGHVEGVQGGLPGHPR